MSWVTGLLQTEERARLVARAPPGWVEPMVPLRADRPFSDPEWLFEPQLSGERCLAWRERGLVRLLRRDRRSVADRYPEIAHALAHQPAGDFLVDGVASAGPGTRHYYHLFDVLYADGYDLRDLPLRRRKRLLRTLLSYADPIRYTNYRIGAGEAYWQEVAAQSRPGIIGKALADSYGGTSARSWLKFPCAGTGHPHRTAGVGTAAGGYRPTSRKPE